MLYRTSQREHASNKTKCKKPAPNHFPCENNYPFSNVFEWSSVISGKMSHSKIILLQNFTPPYTFITINTALQDIHCSYWEFNM